MDLLLFHGFHSSVEHIVWVNFAFGQKRNYVFVGGLLVYFLAMAWFPVALRVGMDTSKDTVKFFE